MRDAWLRRALAVPFALALTFALSLAHAGPPRIVPPAATPATPPPEDTAPPVAPDSPRAAVTQFLDDCHAQRWDACAKWLDVPREDLEHAPELAQRLTAILDRHVAPELDTISGESSGDLDDGQRRTLETIGMIPMPGGDPEPVRMLRRGKPAGWVFARATVARIDDWYARLPNRWLLDHLPRSLLRPGPFELPWWQWLALPITFVLAWLLGLALGRITRWILLRTLHHAGPRWDARVLELLGGPLVLAWTLVAWRPLFGWLGLPADTAELWLRVDKAGLLLALFWALLRAGDVAAQLITSSRWAIGHASTRSLVRLGTRVAKAAIIAIAIVAFFSELGFPVTSLIAGLGIGGLALALAAQKTVENLFGAFSLGADQPFREGDFVRVDDFTGTVETIGLRSTRFRTPDRTIITIPNGKLAESRLETFAARDRVRLHTFVRLAFDTSSGRLRAVTGAIEALLRAHPKIWPDTMTVALASIGDASLDLEVTAWFQADAIEDFAIVKQDVLFGILEAVEQAGCRLAVPARDVRLAHVDPQK
jgi:MscS family membrane protein